MEHKRTALVLGATGGVGGAIAAALMRDGWHVRAMARDISGSGRNSTVEWVQGDAMRRDDVVAAARGATAIVHAVNPPNYRHWDRLVLPMIDNTIAAAREAGGARIVLPGTIYNYDPEATTVVGSDTPQRPKSEKGKIRVQLEQRLHTASDDVPALILRAGDFFGPEVRSSWFSQAMLSPGKPVRRIVNPARGGGHSWAYLPDLAKAFSRLLDVPARLKPFEVLQFEGLYDEDGKTMLDAIQQVCGRKLPVHGFPWWLMRLAAPFGGFPREAAEIAPYWRHPMRLDQSRLVDLIGAEPHTPLNEAVKTSLIAMGCLTTTADTHLKQVQA